MISLNELKSKIIYPLPRIGMRNIKSSLSVVVCFLVWQVLRIFFPGMEIHPLYAYVSVVLAMRDTPENSFEYGKNRVKGTIIGLSVALFIIFIIEQFNIYLQNIYIKSGFEIIVIAVGTLISLYLAHVLKTKYATAAVVFIICMVRHSSENRYIYAFFRTFETVLGILVAFIVNKYVCTLKKDEKNSNQDKN